jgi:hypothetical protein
MERLDLSQKRLHSKSGKAVRRDFENDRPKIGEAPGNFRSNRCQFGIDLARMRIDPISMRELRARQMHLPNAFKGKFGQDLANPSSPILSLIHRLVRSSNIPQSAV